MPVKKDSMPKDTQKKKGRGNPDKLISLADRTTEEQREIASKGGKASGEVRREARRWRDFYAKVITDKYIGKDETGKPVETTFDDMAKEAMKRILEKSDSSTIALMREMRQTQDGDVLEINAAVTTTDLTEAMSYEDKVRLAKEWAKKNLS